MICSSATPGSFHFSGVWHRFKLTAPGLCPCSPTPTPAPPTPCSSDNGPPGRSFPFGSQSSIEPHRRLNSQFYFSVWPILCLLHVLQMTWCFPQKWILQGRHFHVNPTRILQNGPLTSKHNVPSTSSSHMSLPCHSSKRT